MIEWYHSLPPKQKWLVWVIFVIVFSPVTLTILVIGAIMNAFGPVS